MLEYLRIRGLALIDDMELEFGDGMNVLTGETGAGKSFILKAINFVLGDKLSTDMVRPGRDKAQVEALFTRQGEQGEEEIVLRRELSASSGRSPFSALLILSTASCSSFESRRSSLLVPDFKISIAGNILFSESLRSNTSSILPVPLNSSYTTSSILLPVSTSAVASIVRLPPSLIFLAAPKKRFGM